MIQSLSLILHSVRPAMKPKLDVQVIGVKDGHYVGKDDNKSVMSTVDKDVVSTGLGSEKEIE